MTDKLGLIVLAAGLSKRLGQPKQLLPLGGRPLLSHVLSLLASFSWAEKIVIIGEPREALSSICEAQGFPWRYNAQASGGMSTSLRLGVASLSDSVEGFCFVLGDQPFLNGELIKGLCGEFFKEKKSSIIAVPSYQGRLYTPTIFGSAWRTALLEVEGDQGGRALIKENLQHVRKVPWLDPLPFIDVDIPEDYRKIQEIYQKTLK